MEDWGVYQRRQSIEPIIDYMLKCGKQLMGFPRGDYFPLKDPKKDLIENYWFQDVGPSWACNEPIELDTERLERLKNEGMVCIGLISVLLRCVLKPGKKMPSLDPENYGKFKDLRKDEKIKYDYYENLVDTEWVGKNADKLEMSTAFGLNDTTEWLYIYTYGGKKGKIIPFDKTASYPRGTLLFHCFDPYTQGHIAMMHSHYMTYEGAEVLHTIGGSVGAGKVAIEPLSYSHEYFSRGKSWKFDWDEGNKYSIKFYTKDGKPMPYYTHVLLPEDYIDSECFAVPANSASLSQLDTALKF
ncbi:MAG: hypothetical protein CMO44_05195 [Verrucomicrobiales bacterium]|nr:hypothetical protein [Verrucomicrobiales bacterium]